MNDPKVFKNLMAVLSYLKGCGFKLQKTKLYNDHTNGLLRVQADGTVYLADVKGYAQNLSKFTGKFATPEERTTVKLEAEINKLHEQVKALQWTREKDSGKYMLRGDFAREMASRAIVLDVGIRQAMRINAAKLIAAVGGNAELEDALLNEFDIILDEQMNSYASTKTWQVILTADNSEGVKATDSSEEAGSEEAED